MATFLSAFLWAFFWVGDSAVGPVVPVVAGRVRMAVVSFFGGLLGLLVAGHFVVAGASALGRRLGLTPMVIGLTIVAGGTSAPEMAVVLGAVFADDTDLAVGSVIGSNIANVLLVLGVSASFGAIRVTSRVVRVDIPIMIVASASLLVLSLDGRLTRPDGVLLFVGLVAFVAWTLRAARAANAALVTADSADGSVAGAATVSLSDSESETETSSRSATLSGSRQSGSRQSGSRQLMVDLAQVILGAGGLAIAAGWVVAGAEAIAADLGIPELIVGLTILALGTSAPEIVTSIIAVLRGERELAVGNAVGSNIFNILLVLGFSTIVAPDGIGIGSDALELDLPILLAAAVACLPMVFWDGSLDRWEGMVFVGYYLAYLLFLVLDATGHRASDPFALVMLGFVMPLTVVTIAVVVIRQRAASRPQRETVSN